MKSIKTSCKLTAILLICIMLTACGSRKASEEKVQKQVFAMDTVMLLTAYGDNAEAALEDAEQHIYAIEADLDPESVTGSVYAMNAGAGLPVEVSPETYSVMSTALDYWERTDGALDPSLYPIIKLWGFTTGMYYVPSAAELDALLPLHTGEITLGEENTVCLPYGTQVSLGAIGKGYTAQSVIDLLREEGVESAILSLGGNVQTLGDTKPDGSPWQIAVTDPRDTGAYVGIITAGETAAVTSGGYQRYFEQDGVTYIHILDPATGIPVDNDLLSVTVVTEDGTAADALSTAMFVKGLEGALAYYEEHGEAEGFELVLITEDDRVIVTPGLVSSFRESGEGYTYVYME